MERAHLAESCGPESLGGGRIISRAHREHLPRAYSPLPPTKARCSDTGLESALSSGKHLPAHPKTSPSGPSPTRLRRSKALLLSPTDHLAIAVIAWQEVVLSRTQNPFSPKQLSSQNGEGPWMLNGSFFSRVHHSCQQGHSHTCLPDPHAGMPRSAGSWCLPQLYKVGQAWVSGKGVSFQKFQERM